MLKLNCTCHDTCMFPPLAPFGWYQIAHFMSGKCLPHAARAACAAPHVTQCLGICVALAWLGLAWRFASSVHLPCALLLASDSIFSLAPEALFSIRQKLPVPLTAKPDILDLADIITSCATGGYGYTIPAHAHAQKAHTTTTAWSERLGRPRRYWHSILCAIRPYTHPYIQAQVAMNGCATCASSVCGLCRWSSPIRAEGQLHICNRAGPRPLTCTGHQLAIA